MTGTSVVLMSKLLSMLIMVCLGIVIVRIGMVSSDDSRVLSSLVVYVLQPALIIHAFQLEMTAERLHGFLFTLAICMGVFIVWIILSFLTQKPLGLDSIDRTTLVYPNVGNLTLPVVEMVLGEEMLFYVAALQIPFNLFMWTHGISIISRENRLDFKKMINSNLIAMFIGLVIFFFDIPLPDVIDTTILTLNNAVASLSMIVIGMVIGNRSLKHIFLQKRAYLIVLGRLIGMPFIAMLALYVTGLVRHFPNYAPMLQAVFMGLCAPPASTISQLAVVYDDKPFEASVYNMLGTFLCVLTIPLMNLVFETLFL